MRSEEDPSSTYSLVLFPSSQPGTILVFIILKQSILDALKVTSILIITLKPLKLFPQSVSKNAQEKYILEIVAPNYQHFDEDKLQSQRFLNKNNLEHLQTTSTLVFCLLRNYKDFYSLCMSYNNSFTQWHFGNIRTKHHAPLFV